MGSGCPGQRTHACFLARTPHLDFFISCSGARMAFVPLGAVWVTRGQAWSPATEGSGSRLCGGAEPRRPGGVQAAAVGADAWPSWRKPASALNLGRPLFWVQEHGALGLPVAPSFRLSVRSFWASVHGAEGV